MNVRYETRINAPLTDVFAFYNDLNNLPRITPPNMQTEIVDVQGDMRAGTRIELRVKMLVVWSTWVVRIEEHVPNRYFVDRQEKGPFATFRHRHEFVPDGEGTRLIDDVEFELPYYPLSWPVQQWLVKARVDAMFAYRHQQTQHYLER